MRILVLGGTQMLGRDFVERNRVRHTIVLANRGLTRPDLFADLEHVRIDRDAECRVLESLGAVDAVVDFSCYTAAHLESTIPFLPDYGRYVYVSTMSVFDQAALQNPNLEDPYYWYCVNKIGCEAWIRAYAGRGRWSVARPCAVVGPHDYTGRFFERAGRYFWKCNGQEAGAGTVPVATVSEALGQEISACGYREIEVCKG